MGTIGFEMNSMSSKDFQGNYIYTELKKKWEHVKLVTILYLQAFFLKYIAVNILFHFTFGFVSTANANGVCQHFNYQFCLQ